MLASNNILNACIVFLKVFGFIETLFFQLLLTVVFVFSDCFVKNGIGSGMYLEKFVVFFAYSVVCWRIFVNIVRGFVYIKITFVFWFHKYFYSFSFFVFLFFLFCELIFHSWSFIKGFSVLFVSSWNVFLFEIVVLDL